MRYVDGFIVPVPKNRIAAYRAMARKAGKIWREHGALEFTECVADESVLGTAGSRYTSLCDPRLTPQQAVEVASAWRMS